MADPQDNMSWTGTYGITGKIPYYEQNYAGRMITEECDNGGDEEHGCDRLCQVMDGWQCFDYYHYLLGVEVPYFTSICEEVPDDPSQHWILEERRRRLRPEDFDKHGRFLHNVPRW